MSFRQIIPLFLMVSFAANVKADSSAYVVSAGITGDGIFGTVDLNTGAFQQIGPVEPDGYFGLAQSPNGSLAALTYAGNFVSINPATGVPAQVGATGLGACVVPTPACGPTSAFSLGGLNGTIYATDYANSVFVINPSTGAATLLAQKSGIPPSPFVLGSQNANGTFNFGMKLFGTQVESCSRRTMLGSSIQHRPRLQASLSRRSCMRLIRQRGSQRPSDLPRLGSGESSMLTAPITRSMI